MNGVELLAETGDQKVDRALRGMIGIFETLFQDRIRSYYLIGSYADGTAISSVSDMDGFIIFKDDFLDGAEPEKAWRTLSNCALLTTLELDLVAVPETSILRYGHVVLKYNSTLIYGEDIRENIPLPDIDIFGHSLLLDAYHFLARVRGNPPYLTFPLEYPDPNAKFYGYTQRMQTNGEKNKTSTKELINCVGKAALAMVTIQGRVYVKNKVDCIAQYKNHIGDEWGDLLEDIFMKCRNQWHYRIPDGETQQEELRTLCQRTLEFENHFLMFYKDILVKTLRNSDKKSGVWVDLETASMVFFDETLTQNLSDYNIQVRVMNQAKEVFIESPEKIMAVRALGRVIDPDDEAVIDLLQENENSQNIHLKYFAQKSLKRYLHN